jgi:hypothetical protein
VGGVTNGNGATLLTWAGRPFKIGEYLSAVGCGHNPRPPDAAGVYVVSEKTWKGAPDATANLLYAGQARYLRYRIGQLLRDLLGFTSDDAADGEAYVHRGRHLLWHRYCRARGVEPTELYFACCAPCKCTNCALKKLLEMTLFASACTPQRACDQHNPALELTDNCSATVTLPGLAARLLHSDKS